MNPARRDHGLIPIAGVLFGLLGGLAAACPFCDVVGRPLAERRDAAAIVAVGEASDAARDDAGVVRQPFSVRGVLRGIALAPDDVIAAHVPGPVTGTALLFGDDAGRFEAVAADEALLGYVAAAPATEAATADRLAWFARWLEHPNPAVAEDAFSEFGIAPFEAVVAAAGGLDAEKLAGWLAEPAIDQRRRGFYGLALGIVARRAAEAGDAPASARWVAALEHALTAEGTDLRAGYDGLLGGLLFARGDEALDWFREHGLLEAQTRAGDARHTLAALRFAWEYLADDIPQDDIATAAAPLLANPAVAADVTVDLARWKHWESVDAVAALWERLGADDPLVRRAVAGYLTACPLAAARHHAEAIAAADPERWAAAVAAANLPPRATK